MKILLAVLLGILYLPITPLLIIFLGGAELYKLYMETYNALVEHLDKSECEIEES